MPGTLIRLAGPAGAGKSGRSRRMLAGGEADLLVDFTALWAALGGHERDADGRYPVREDSDPLLPLAHPVRAFVVAEALRRGFRTLRTSSSSTDADADRATAKRHGAAYREITVDPGESVIRARLADPETGELSPQCSTAVRRWYRR